MDSAHEFIFFGYFSQQYLYSLVEFLRNPYLRPQFSRSFFIASSEQGCAGARSRPGSDSKSFGIRPESIQKYLDLLLDAVGGADYDHAVYADAGQSDLRFVDLKLI